MLSDTVKQSELSSNAAGKGAAMIGIEDAGNRYTAETVEGVLQELWGTTKRRANPDLWVDTAGITGSILVSRAGYLYAYFHEDGRHGQEVKCKVLQTHNTSYNRIYTLGEVYRTTKYSNNQDITLSVVNNSADKTATITASCIGSSDGKNRYMRLIFSDLI